MDASKKQREPVAFKSLAELKRFIRPGVEIKTVSHANHADMVGLTRVVTTVQTVGFYSKIKDQPEHPFSTCNHGKGLAVIHPVLYRHLCTAGAARFARFAQNVFGLAPKDSIEETALAGVEALAAFIKEIGLPTTLTELGIPADTDLRAVADSTNITAGCCKKLTHDEIYEILLECK